MAETRLVWFHIGFHKTGTTAVQNVFDRSRDILAAAGVLFPHVGFSRLEVQSAPGAAHGHGLVARALRREKAFDPGEKIVSDLADEIVESGLPQVLLSSELMAAPTHPGAPANIPRFLDLLSRKATAGQPEGGPTVVYEPRVLVYLRRQDAYADSMYREILCWAGTRETRDFPAFVADEGPTWLDYPGRLAPWRDALGDGRIVLRSYEETVQGPGLLAEVCGLLGLNTRVFRDLQRRAPAAARGGNPSLPAAFVDLMRAINAEREYSRVEKADISYRLLGQLSGIRTDQAPLTDAETWRRIREAYGPGNRALRDALAPECCAPLLFPEEPPANLGPARQVLSYDSARALVGSVRTPAFDGAGFAARGSYGTITTLKQSVQQTLEFVHYHLNIGADRVVLFFDDPRDPAIARVEGYDRVVAVRCDATHWYEALGYVPDTMSEKIRANMRVGCEMLRAADVEWGICLDADELLHNRNQRRLQGHLEGFARDVGVVKVWPVESVLTDDMRERTFASTWFRRRPLSNSGLSARAKSAALKLATRGRREVTRDGFFGHVEGKAFVRLRHRLEDYRHHNPRPASAFARQEESVPIWLLHFDCPEFSEWKLRWERRVTGESRQVNIGDKRARQQEIIADAVARGDRAMRRLYRKWFFVSRPERAYLRAFRLIARIPLDQRLFEPPAPETTERAADAPPRETRQTRAEKAA